MRRLCDPPISSIMRIIAHKYALMGPYAAPLEVRGSHPVVRSPIICTSFGRWPANIRCMHELPITITMYHTEISVQLSQGNSPTCVSKYTAHASLCQHQIILYRVFDDPGGVLQFTRIAHITRNVTFVPG